MINRNRCHLLLMIHTSVKKQNFFHEWFKFFQQMTLNCIHKKLWSLISKGDKNQEKITTDPRFRKMLRNKLTTLPKSSTKLSINFNHTAKKLPTKKSNSGSTSPKNFFISKSNSTQPSIFSKASILSNTTEPP